jgi:tetratricopeptide (TPR) repeat protein
MKDYEFWDELSNIFDAVLAYQKKTIEFNKRFISPWIRLGNVFDKQERNREAVQAYQQAVEIDPENARNWATLGDSYFKMGSFEEARSAYQQSIELDPGDGWSFSNLALTLVSLGQCEAAIPLYQKSIELLEQDQDKAVSWNRLGNVYRKLNDYDRAVAAFLKADQLDAENAGFRDRLDEKPDEPTLEEVSPEAVLDAQPANDVAAGPAAAEGQEAKPDGAGSAAPVEPEAVETGPADLESGVIPQEPPTPQPGHEPEGDLDVKETQAAKDAGVIVPENGEAKTRPVGAHPGPQGEVLVPADTVTQTTTLATLVAVETYTEFEPLPNGLEELDLAENQPGELAGSAESKIPERASTGADPAPDAQDSGPLEVSEVEAAQPEAMQDQGESVEVVPVPEGMPVEAEAEMPPSSGQELKEAAYEEYLKDTIEPVRVPPGEAGEAEVEKPLAQISESGEVEIEMDTQNPHVWNELGNVYFNSGSYEDAIAAYAKAIELDQRFAWAYSNLALAYVQKGRCSEAVLLYQRSIELFTDDRDKAITWNRLGNVYRRMNDYDNAIGAYRTADELDPDNTTLSLRSRFSLLGNVHLEQKPNYVS